MWWEVPGSSRQPSETLCETGIGEVLLHFLHGSEQHSRLGVAEDGESEVGAVEEQASLGSLLEAEDAAVVDEVHVLVSSQGDARSLGVPADCLDGLGNLGLSHVFLLTAALSEAAAAVDGVESSESVGGPGVAQVCLQVGGPRHYCLLVI